MIFPLTSVSRPSLGATESPVQLVPGVLSPGLKRGRGVTLSTYVHLVLRSRMSKSYTSSPPSAFVSCSGTALAFSGVIESSSIGYIPGEKLSRVLESMACLRCPCQRSAYYATLELKLYSVYLIIIMIVSDTTAQ
jgi:hypothetical protein